MTLITNKEGPELDALKTSEYAVKNFKTSKNIQFIEKNICIL